MRIAFYAPLKAPDHPMPSGDRQMGRSLIDALRLAGHDVETVSTLRTFVAEPDPRQFATVAATATEEADRLDAAWRRAPAVDRPGLWFTYHNHYKAPDLLGPRMARTCAIPYALAEASHAPRRAADWGPWHEAAETAIRAANVHFCLTMRDRAGIAPVIGPGANLVDLRPFIDGRHLPAHQDRAGQGPVRLGTVAMMRPGDKTQSYRFLAQALATIADHDWTLAVIGDGPNRDRVHEDFAWAGNRVTWHGMLPCAQALDALAQTDVLVWPGYGEAFGLAYLEAQAIGLPVVALDVAGVSSVVEHDRSGLLTPPGDVAAYAAAILALVTDAKKRRTLGSAARTMVLAERTLDQAAATLDHALRRVSAIRMPAP